VDDVDAVPARHRLLSFVGDYLKRVRYHYESLSTARAGIGVKHASSRAMSTLSKVEDLWMLITFARVSVVNGAMSGGRSIR
jgi:hypothetical protein